MAKRRHTAEQIISKLREAEAVDQQESATLFGEDVTPVTLVSKELASVKARQAKDAAAGTRGGSTGPTCQHDMSVQRFLSARARRHGQYG